MRQCSGSFFKPDAKSRTASGPSGQELLDHLASHIRQPKVTPLKPERQPAVINAQQMQNRRLKVVEVNAEFHRGAAEFVRAPDGDAGQRCRDPMGRPSCRTAITAG